MKTINYKKKKGILFIISSPSGGGKTTIARHVVESLNNLCHSISTTTRNPRPGEINGKDYRFITHKEFEKKIKQDKFLEWARVHGNYYGTEKNNLNLIQKGKNDLLLTIDVQGAETIRKKTKDSVSVFIVPPSFKILAERLKKRGVNSPEEMKKRLLISREELTHINKYNYVIINQDLAHAVLELKSIIIAERCKQKKNE